MGYRYKFAFTPPLKVLRAAFGLMADQLNDFRPVWPEVSALVGAGLVENIHQKGRSIGASWPDPTKKYARQKLLKGFGRTQFQRTGSVLAAFSHDTGVLKQGKRWALFAIDGKEAEYGKVLHTGRKPRGKLVKGSKRMAHYKFAGWSPSMIKSYDLILGKYVEGVLDKAVAGMRHG